MPERMRRSVLLPAPLSPTNPRDSPSWSWKVTSLSARSRRVCRPTQSALRSWLKRLGGRALATRNSLVRPVTSTNASTIRCALPRPPRSSGRPKNQGPGRPPRTRKCPPWPRAKAVGDRVDQILPRHQAREPLGRPRGEEGPEHDTHQQVEAELPRRPPGLLAEEPVENREHGEGLQECPQEAEERSLVAELEGAERQLPGDEPVIVLCNGAWH